MVKTTIEKQLNLYYQKNMIKTLENFLLTICETIPEKLSLKQ